MKWVEEVLYQEMKIVQEPQGDWVNHLGTNDDQCFLVNLSMLITILDVMQAKSVGISSVGCQN